MKLKVTTYDELEDHFDSFFNQVIDLLVVMGKGGVGKTYHAKNKCFNDEGVYLSGSQSPLATYKTIYRNIHQPVVFDDIEEILSNKKQRALLKTLADTYEIKELQWNSSTPKLEEVPNSYETTSNACIICNDLPTKGLNREALLSRGLVIEFWPSNEELVNRMAEVTKSYESTLSLDERWEVFEFVKEWIDMSDDANIRTLIIGFQLREGGKEWRDILARGMNIDQRLILIDQLLEKHDKVGDAKREFSERTGYSPRTFSNLKAKLDRGR